MVTGYLDTPAARHFDANDRIIYELAQRNALHLDNPRMVRLGGTLKF